MDICSCFTDLLFILEPLEPQAIPWVPFKWCSPPFCLYIYIYIYIGGYLVADLAIYLYFYHLVQVFHHLLPHTTICGVCEWTFLCSALLQIMHVKYMSPSWSLLVSAVAALVL